MEFKILSLISLWSGGGHLMIGGLKNRNKMSFKVSANFVWAGKFRNQCYLYYLYSEPCFFCLLESQSIYDFLNLTLGFQNLEVMATQCLPEKNFLCRFCFTENSVSDLGIVWFSIMIFKLSHSALSLAIFLYTEKNPCLFLLRTVLIQVIFCIIGCLFVRGPELF